VGAQGRLVGAAPGRLGPGQWRLTRGPRQVRPGAAGWPRQPTAVLTRCAAARGPRAKSKGRRRRAARRAPAGVEVLQDDGLARGHVALPGAERGPIIHLDRNTAAGRGAARDMNRREPVSRGARASGGRAGGGVQWPGTGEHHGARRALQEPAANSHTAVSTPGASATAFRALAWIIASRVLRGPAGPRGGARGRAVDLL
jgi:hypothetical protein